MDDIKDSPAKGIADLWRDAQDAWSYRKLQLLLWFLISFALGGIPLWINYIWGRPTDITLWTNIDNGRILFFCITAVSSASTFILQYKGDQYRDVVKLLHVVFLLLIVLASFKVADSYLAVPPGELFQVRTVSMLIFVVSFVSLLVLQIIKMSDASGFLEEKRTSEIRFAKKPAGG